jgi:RND family efflux transporter MFP subunit
LSQVPEPQGTSATEFHCVIEPQQVVKLASPVVGVVARLDVDRGDIIHRGQVLGKLEDAVEAAALLLAKARATNEYTSKSMEARLDFLRSKHKRVNELYEKAFSSQDALEEAEAAAKVAEQQLKEAELNREIAYLQIRHDEEVLNQRTLRSPFDGVVVERLLQPGEYRNEQTPIITLAQIDLLRVEAFVPTAYYGRIQTGSQAQVRPEKPIGGIHTAVVTVVDRVLDAASGTFGVRLALPNADLRLPAGISCTIEFDMLPTAEAAAALTDGGSRSIKPVLSPDTEFSKAPQVVPPAVPSDEPIPEASERMLRFRLPPMDSRAVTAPPLSSPINKADALTGTVKARGTAEDFRNEEAGRDTPLPRARPKMPYLMTVPNHSIASPKLRPPHTQAW